MPKDSRGNFHNSIQRAMASDQNAMPAPKARGPRPMVTPRSMGAAPEPDGDESGAAGHLKDFQDAMGGGKAMLIHHDGISPTAHQIDEGGQVSGPHNLENLEQLKQSMDQFFSEEEAEPAEEPDMASGGLKGIY